MNPASEITIQCLNKKELQAFVESPDFGGMEFIPISRHRAWSHFHNPRADADDIIMMIAWKADVMMGYLGVLPDLLHLKDGRIEKGGWLSCMWIDPRSRGMGISTSLVKKALEVWDNRILVTEFTAPAKRIYDKREIFDDLQIKKGIRLYVRLDLAKILPPKKAIFQKIKFILKWIDLILNFIFDIRFVLISKKTAKLQFEYVDHIDNEARAFIEAKQSDQIFKRGVNELNWMLQYPWLLSAPVSDNLAERYHFSAIAKRFAFTTLKVRDASDKLTAFIIFAQRDDHLKIPYCYYEKETLPEVIKIIRSHILHWRIKTFSCYQNELVAALKSTSFSLFKKEIQRHYIISQVFGQETAADSYEIQDGDADCAFT